MIICGEKKIEPCGRIVCRARDGVSPFFIRLKSAIKQVGYVFSDIAAAYRNDPALRGKIFGFLELAVYAGIWAIIMHRITHLLFSLKIPFIPRLLSQVSRFLTGIEIHPGAKIGRGIFIDHGHGVVIGETAEIGENVILYQQVTLGGIGFSSGKRHPTLGGNIVVGAGAKILGAITIGDDTIIGAGAIVVKDIPDHAVVVGNPGRVVKRFGTRIDLPLSSIGSLPREGHNRDSFSVSGSGPEF